ncbi:MAG: DUF547 domain-containing protein [Myxococcota bacterium]
MLAALLVLSSLTAGGGDALEAYSAVLKQNVAKGRVNYPGVAAMRDELDRYINHVATSRVPGGKNRAMAFYIDAYNALVLASVLDSGQPKSVLDVKDFFKRKVHTVAGKKVSLDQLEKEILNPLAKDPRTHMVLVCAAIGCPILDPRPYTGSNLERRLEHATVRYIRSPSGARISDGALAMSKIFEWYAADFGGADAAVEFVRKRLKPEKNETLGESPKVSTFDYNWRLNKR